MSDWKASLVVYALKEAAERRGRRDAELSAVNQARDILLEYVSLVDRLTEDGLVGQHDAQLLRDTKRTVERLIGFLMLRQPEGAE